jgi:PhnB protein
MMPMKAVPTGYHTMQPYFVVKDTPAAIEFYKKAFGMQEIMRMLMPDGQTVMHAELRMGDSVLMLSEENPQWNTKSPQTLGGSPVTIHCCVENVDELFAQVVAAGCKVKMPPSDMFWGDRMCGVEDPFGHHWSLAQHIEDVSPEEMQRRGDAFFGGSAGAGA